MKLAVKSGTA